MAYTVNDLSNIQKFEYKGYTIQLYCIDNSFWTGKRVYQVNIFISDLTYYDVVMNIYNMRMQKRARNPFIPLTVSPIITPNRQTMDSVKKIVPFYESFTIDVNRKYTILIENRPYVLDAISQVKSIIDTKYGEAINRFSINTIDLLI